MVNDGIVSGWDDPRLPTIKGLRRRGYTPEAIRDLAQRSGVGIGNSGGQLSIKVLEECIRQHLDRVAPRVMAVTDPIKLVIVNWEEVNLHEIQIKDFPALKEKSPTHSVNFDRVVWIEREDFRITTDKNYYRLTPIQKIRLKYAGLVEYVSHDVFTIYVRFLGETGEKVKGTVNWIAGETPLKVEARFFEHLFPEELNEEKDWITQINPNSMMSKEIYVDSLVNHGKPFDKFQLERIGYFSVDPNSTPDHLILNHTVSLKEDKTKN